jgi:hypothetical protein
MRDRAKAGAALLATALVLGDVSPLLHVLFVEHETCPEHGELVDVRTDSEARSRFVEELHQRALASSSEPRRSPTDHDHDHCTIAAHVASPALAAGAEIALDIERPASRSSVADLDASPQKRVLLIAPKTSPPALS